MKKVFKIQDLDCAHCAAKIEAAIQKLEGVTSATVNFMMQKMTVEANDDRFDTVVDEIVKVMHKIEPDCSLVRR